MIDWLRHVCDQVRSELPCQVFSSSALTSCSGFVLEACRQGGRCAALNGKKMLAM